MSELSAAVHREVDLVDLRTANLDLVREVLRDGQVLSLRNAPETLMWEAERLTDYGDFNARRGEILDRYLHEPLLDR